MLRAGKIYLSILILYALSAMPALAAASRGVALVIGNSAYQHASELRNPRNDAEDMAAAFEATGFKVVKGVDLDRASMERTVRKFARALKTAQVGVFFYAGHALQINGHNYLVPIDAQLEDATGVDFELIRLGLVQRTMERSVKTNLIFLDACRNNPLARNLARAMGTRSAALGTGLASVEGGIGTMISFSTQPGNVALDGEGRNSPFAGALAKRIMTTDGDISDVLINVRRDVMEQTGRRQIPWEHSALTAKFFFKTPSATIPSASASPLRSQSLDVQAELAHWNAVRDAQSPDIIETYLTQYPKGKFAAVARVLIARSKRQRKNSAASAANGSRSNIAALSAANMPSAEDGKSNFNPAEIALVQQRELQRVGCYANAIDGDWGAGSKRAMANFNNSAKLQFRTDVPTAEAVMALKRIFARVCARPARAIEKPTSSPSKARKKSSKTAVRAKSCRRESKFECKQRVCAGGGCRHLRGSGICSSSRRRKICR